MDAFIGSDSDQGLYVPPFLKRGGFVFFAADNTDFAEDTPDGKGTTHGTIIAVYQKNAPSGEPIAEPLAIGEAGRFSRVGKATWLQAYLRTDEDVINALQMLEEAEVTDGLLSTLAGFVFRIKCACSSVSRFASSFLFIESPSCIT